MRKLFVSKFLVTLSALVMMFALSACGGGSPNLSDTSAPNSGQNQSGGGGSTIPVGNLSVALSWTPPLTYIDNTPLNDLAGTNIYVKVGNGNYQLLTSVKSSGSVSYVVHNLSGNNTYTFAITAINSLGVESAFSTPVTIQL